MQGSGPSGHAENDGIEHLPTLDGWRAVAILAVLWCHLNLTANWASVSQQYSALGVDLFFAISGLLITYRLLQEHKIDGNISLRSFYIRRAFRILPPALLFLAVIAVLSAGNVIPASRMQILSAVFFFRNYCSDNSVLGWFTGHYWSLSVEEHFYLFWPCLLLLMGIRRARYITPFIALAAAAWRTLDFNYHFISSPHLLYAMGRTDYCVDFLLWGCASALLLHERRYHSWLRRVVPSLWPFIALAACAALVIYRPKGNVALLAFLMATLPVSTLLHPRSWFSRRLESAPMMFIGKLSYSIYLWQQLFFVQGRTNALGYLHYFPLSFLAVLFVAWISYRFVEQPLRRMGKRIASGSAGAKTVEPVAVPLQSPVAAE